ncbi:hypothetical protein BG003_010985 [Podila horticola]|nr:hypothetical protein BG003_010985 [Podila horticola]
MLVETQAGSKQDSDPAQETKATVSGSLSSKSLDALPVPDDLDEVMLTFSASTLHSHEIYGDLHGVQQ